MKSEKLQDAVGEVRDDYILDADSVPKRRHRWIGWVAAAACVVLAVGIFNVVKHGNGFGAAAGGGGGEGVTYMSYAGPVFPLSATEGTDLTVERSIGFDFSPYRTVEKTTVVENETMTYERYSQESIVTDSYVLKNTSDTAKTATLIYPFAGSLNSDDREMPTVRVNGETVKTNLHIGPYSGGFAPVYGNPKNTERVNLAYLDSWEKYDSLIGAGYQARAFDELPTLEQPVTVYEISDRFCAQSNDNSAASLNMEFHIDYSKTRILTYGFNSGTNDEESGYCARGTHIPREKNPDYGKSAWMIVLGDDIGDYTLKAYTNGAHDTPLENAGATVTRSESTLGEIMLKIARQFLNEYPFSERDTILNIVSDAEYLGLTAELMYDYGMLSDTPAERYGGGFLEDMLSETGSMGRVMYLTFDVTIPANGQVEVSAEMVKKASYDFYGEKLRRNGYDTVTSLGSTLSFEQQNASIENYESVRIINQNFGFDPEHGITSVVLDMNEPHYYLEVEKIQDEN